LVAASRLDENTSVLPSGVRAAAVSLNGPPATSYSFLVRTSYTYTSAFCSASRRLYTMKFPSGLYC